MPVAAAAPPPFGPRQVCQSSFNATLVLFMKAHNKPAHRVSGTRGLSEPLSALTPRVFIPGRVPTTWIYGTSVSRLPAKLCMVGQAVGISACTEGPASGQISVVPGP